MQFDKEKFKAMYARYNNWWKTRAGKIVSGILVIFVIYAIFFWRGDLDCDSEKVANFIAKSIADQTIDDKASMYSLSAIRTHSVNEHGLITCQAQARRNSPLEITGWGGSTIHTIWRKPVNIVYTIQKTADSDQFYVELQKYDAH